jgi:hypothetical protein
MPKTKSGQEKNRSTVFADNPKQRPAVAIAALVSFRVIHLAKQKHRA